MHNLRFLTIVKQGFRTEIELAIMISTMFAAWIVASVRFWIIFRFLQWMPHREDARCIAAFVIACAVSFYHYSATFAINDFVDYTNANDNLIGVPAFNLAIFALIFSWTMCWFPPFQPFPSFEQASKAFSQTQVAPVRGQGTGATELFLLTLHQPRH